MSPAVLCSGAGLRPAADPLQRQVLHRQSGSVQVCDRRPHTADQSAINGRRSLWNTSRWESVPIVHYLLTGYLLVLGADGSILHTVDAVSGKQGVWLFGVPDIAVWQGCIWLQSLNGVLVLLC